MTIKAGVLAQVVALPITREHVDRDPETDSKLRAGELGTIAIARVTKSAGQALTTATETVVSWNQEDFDTANLHDNSSNNSRLTAPVAGKYRLEAVLSFAFHATGHRDLFYKISGATAVMLASVSANAADPTVVHASTVLVLVAGDYVEVVGEQGSGGALDIESARSHAILQYIGE